MSRSSFYPVPGVPVEDLLLDTLNPRIRHGQDQNDCIHRLLRDRSNFVNLCKDIAARGLTPEHILVSKNTEGKWVVRDGNRRVAALKILNDPARVHSDAALFSTLTRAISDAVIPSKVDCLACDDERMILDYLERKHTGANQGIGQRDWSALLKSLFNLQADARDDNKRAAQLLLWVEERGYGVEDDFPITTLQRGLNVQTLALLGFEIRNDDLTAALPEHQAYHLAARVVHDVASGEVNVKREVEQGSIFTPEAQLAFFTRIRTELGPPLATIVAESMQNPPTVASAGRIPQPATSHTVGVSDAPVPPTVSNNMQTPSEPPAGTRRPISPNTAPQDRKRLFGPGRNPSPGITIPAGETKAQAILVELRKMDTQDTPLATAMLLRALIEASNNQYRATRGLDAISTLHQSVANSADHQLQNGLITQAQHDVVMAYTRSQQGMLHIKTLHHYVHRTTNHPTGQGLNALWDEFGCFVRACWR